MWAKSYCYAYSMLYSMSRISIFLIGDLKKSMFKFGMWDNNMSFNWPPFYTVKLFLFKIK